MLPGSGRKSSPVRPVGGRELIVGTGVVLFVGTRVRSGGAGVVERWAGREAVAAWSGGGLVERGLVGRWGWSWGMGGLVGWVGVDTGAG